ncbi:MAG: hypothetical protein EXR99_09660 [Gemmataceae bacterium]|nr:hypothetical protein [Gemmataceae bacterium]
MAQVCPRCSRVNPDEASYCYFDGIGLGSHPHSQHDLHRFLNPFKFPSGRLCANFEELVEGILGEWSVAVELNRKGEFVNFFSSIGRLDLAMAARSAKEFPAADQGLDKLLDRMPVSNLGEAQLVTDTETLNLGLLRVGQKFKSSVKLRNKGRRLLFGTVTLEGLPWLSLSQDKARPRSRFQLIAEAPLPLYTLGDQLRSSDKPLEGKLILETNGGSKVIVVRADVPVRPFMTGALAGARSPREVAEKSKANAREAGALFESGAVERWYKDNGWKYPVPGPAASGLASVQQFFEALGLARAPKVEIDSSFLTFDLSHAAPAAQYLAVSSPEKKPVYAHAVAGAPWVSIGQMEMKGSRALIPISVNPSFLQSPRQSTWVRVNSNGNQSFLVTVEAIQPGAGFADLAGAAAPLQDFAPARVVESSSAELLLPEAPADFFQAPILGYHPLAQKVKRGRWVGWVFLIFLLLLFLGLVGTIAVLGLKKLQNNKEKR